MVALVLTTIAAPTAPAATWSTQATPNAAGATDGTLRSVSCPSTTSCAAVGQYTNEARRIVTLAEHWAEGTWRIQATPNPGSGVDPLLAVSCTSAAACTATGSTPARTAPIAERWNGREWTLQRTQERAGSNLEGAACFSAEGCVAVGRDSLGALAEHWNGAAWRTQTVPSPPDPFEEGLTTHSTHLVSVSCTASTFCLAVGTYTVEFGLGLRATLPLTETWSGTAWEARETPAATEYLLQDVSCTSTTFCMAVGQTGESTLALSWNGSAWRVQETPAVESRSTLLGVSCTSASSCTAVGFSNNGSYHTLAMHWDGRSWATQTTPNPGRGGILNGVSCPASAVCTSVGHTIEASGTIVTLALRYE